MTQGQLEKIPAALEKQMRMLEVRIMDDMVRRIRINGFGTASASWQYTRLKQLGMSDKEIKKWVAECLEASDKEVDRIFSEETYKEYTKAGRGYDLYGKEQIPFEDNIQLQMLVEGVSRQTKGTLSNMTSSLGFVVDNGRRVHGMTLTDYYRTTLDEAVMDIQSGAFDYNTVLTRTINDMTKSGLRWIDYSAGHHNRLPVAARRAVMTGFRQVQGKINEQVAEQLGTDTYEVTVHIGARPSHQVWEGKIWTMAELRSVCGLGTVTGLHGANCYHDYNAFIPGVDVPAYSQSELERIHAQENAVKTYNGKEYDTYEALQHQRHLETRARKYREDVHLLEEGMKGVEGEEAEKLQETINAKKSRYQKTLQEYKAFSDKMGLPMEKERIYQDGLSVDMRAPKKSTENNSQAGSKKNKELLERARTIKTESDLKTVSKSSIINMKSYSEIADYFMQKYGITVGGFSDKNLLAVQSPLAGYDDMLEEFPEIAGRIKSIQYNSRIAANADIDLNSGNSRVGKSGLFDYGSGVHESAHMLDHVRSGKLGYNYAESVVERARKNLGLRKNSKKYKDLKFQIVGMVKKKATYEDFSELFAFAIETAKGNVDNILANEIYKIAREG